MGKQVLGGLMMFATIWVVPYAQFSAPDTQELETLRTVLLVAIRGFAFVILFCVFFVGLKVFAIGLEQERAGRAGDTRPSS
jgi:hypothetical protein